MKQSYRLERAFYRDNLNTGNYIKRDRVWKTNRFKFDGDTCEAYSYDWWLFVIRVGNTIYFNDASYSMQTRKHQAMAKNIIDLADPELHGIQVKYVYYREGLNHLSKAIENREYEIETLKKDILKPRSHKAKNEWRRERITDLIQEIKDTRKLKKLLDKQIGKNGDLNYEKHQIEHDRYMKSIALARMKAEKERFSQPQLTLVSGGAS